MPGICALCGEGGGRCRPCSRCGMVLHPECVQSTVGLEDGITCDRCRLVLENPGICHPPLTPTPASIRDFMSRPPHSNSPMCPRPALSHPSIPHSSITHRSIHPSVCPPISPFAYPSVRTSSFTSNHFNQPTHDIHSVGDCTSFMHSDRFTTHSTNPSFQSHPHSYNIPPTPILPHLHMDTHTHAPHHIDRIPSDISAVQNNVLSSQWQFPISSYKNCNDNCINCRDDEGRSGNGGGGGEGEDFVVGEPFAR